MSKSYDQYLLNKIMAMCIFKMLSKMFKGLFIYCVIMFVTLLYSPSPFRIIIWLALVPKSTSDDVIIGMRGSVAAIRV